MALTNTLANLVLNQYFTNNSLYLALHITDPTNAGLANTELTTTQAPNYARQALTWSVPSNRSVSNTAIISFPGLPILSMGYLGAWDALTGGNLLAVFPAPNTLSVTSSGGSIYLPINSLVVTIGGSPDGRLTPVPTNPFATYTEDPLNPGVLNTP